MKLFSADKSELMNVSAIERDGNDLVIKGKVFGAMPMAARLTPEQARAAFKLVNLKLIFFVLTLPFRKSR
jgi:hypothetical protein